MRYNSPMIILIVIAIILLCAVAGIVPRRSQLSEFELQRRLEGDQPGSMLEWQRRELYVEVMTLRRIAVAFLLVVSSALIIARFGWLWGLIGAFMLTLLYNRGAAFGPLRRFVQSQYDRREAGLLQWLDRHRSWVKPFSGSADNITDPLLASRQELIHLVDNADASILSKDEKKMIRGSLGFADKQVREYMTPRSVMEVIGVNELLGPLVLDDLHKTGHSHFPVLDGDIDHIVGMLHLHNILNVVKQRSVTVGDVMEPKVLFIHEEQTLGEALSACIKYRRHLLVVINEFRETTGVITIEDAVEQLIGQKIIDENDNHEDLRAVAARNPRHNNKSPNGSDV